MPCMNLAGISILNAYNYENSYTEEPTYTYDRLKDGQRQKIIYFTIDLQMEIIIKNGTSQGDSVMTYH